jgi:hypothetical protein
VNGNSFQQQVLQMRKLFLLALTAMMVGLFGFMIYTDVSVWRQRHVVELADRAKIEKSIEAHRAALADIAKLVDALPPSEEKQAALLDVQYAGQYLDRAENGVTSSAFSGASSLEMANFWLLMAKKNGNLTYSVPVMPVSVRDLIGR